jgi:immune inhibitor InhA-like protein
MKNFRPHSFSQRHAAIMFILSLTFLSLFSISRSFAQQDDDEEEDDRHVPARMRSENIFGAFDYDAFLVREENGEFSFQGGDVPAISPFNSLTNNNAGANGTGFFTQSETAIAAFGNTVVVGFNDAGSNAGGTNKFTGFARSINGGATFTDGGTLPTNPGGDAGDPVLARDNTTGRLYFTTLGFSVSTIQVFRSDDDGATWMAPVNGTPGGSGEDKEWITVDNFAGPGNGNVYLVSRRFGGEPGIYFFSSTDHGSTFGPNGGTLITPGSQGAFVAVDPDHSVYVFWYAGTTIQVRKSTDQGTTFGAPMTVASGLIGGTNGDLGLTGIRQGTTTSAGFRSSEFPHAAVNPVNGNIYVTFANNPDGADKADIFLAQSTDGGATWEAPIRVNDDATTTDQWQPTLAVTPDGSNLGIFYYSRQEDTVGNNLFKFYGRTAVISGSTLTFTPSFAVSDVASLPEFGRDGVINLTYMGDYDMAVATPGAFHVVWADNRNDLLDGAGRKDPNVFYKRIDLSIHVTTTVPAVASVITTQPTTFTVNISEQVDPASLQASDFAVNGISASNFAYTPGSTTIVFTFGVSPVTTEGLQTMSIVAGAFTGAITGNPVGAFTGTFRFDTLLLQVVATAPQVGGVFTLPGPFTYDVTFNELINPASVQPGDLQLSGGASTVVAASVLPGNTTVRFIINATIEVGLTASIPAGAITDAFGNAGAAFTGSYIVDLGTAPYPTPLLAKKPQGSLIYEPGVAGKSNIGFAGDTDSFTLAIDPDQTLTAIVTGSGGLQPVVELHNPDSTVIGSATAVGGTQIALLQTAPAATGGTYTFTVGGAGGTTGDFTLQVILNYARELEGTISSATNNTLAAAQNIDGSFIKLRTSVASASRGAVFGGNAAAPSAPFQAFDFESGQQGFVINNGPQPGHVAGLWHLSTGRGTQTGHSPVTSFYFGQGEGPGDGDYDVGNTAGTITSGPIALPNRPGLGLTFNYVLQTEGNGSFDVASVQVSTNGGATFTTIASSTSPAQLPLSGAWRNASFSLAAFAGQTVLIRFSFDTVDSAVNDFEGWYVDDVQVTAPGAWHDYYSFSASANDVVSAALKTLSGAGANVFLEDCAGTVLTTSSGGSTNYENGIRNFLITTGGTYYLRVSGTVAATYDLVVTRNAAFDTEDNDTIATAQNLNPARGALGHVTGGAAPVQLQNLDDGLLTSYTFLGPNRASVTAAAAHDGPFGLQLETFTEWMWRNDSSVEVRQGDTISAWVQAAGEPTGRVYLGFGASATGTYSMVLGGNTGTLILQRNDNFGFMDIGVVPQTWVANKWYRFEVVWGVGGSITGRLFDSDGTTLLNAVTATDTTITSGGLAFRAFGLTHYVDSVLKGGQRNDDWYSVTVIQGRLQFETSTPGDGPGEFVNTLDPHIELYDSAGGTLIATGAPLEDGRNESIDVSGLPAPATYLVRVTAEGDTKGEYFLGTGAPPTFTGFFPPLSKDNYNAGSTIPVKFSLGLNLGLDILASGSPVSRQINCSPNGCGATVGIGPWEPTRSELGLQYDPMANQYIYYWKTSNAWSGTCRELEVILQDGRQFRTKLNFR